MLIYLYYCQFHWRKEFVGKNRKADEYIHIIVHKTFLYASLAANVEDASNS